MSLIRMGVRLLTLVVLVVSIVVFSIGWQLFSHAANTLDMQLAVSFGMFGALMLIAGVLLAGVRME